MQPDNPIVGGITLRIPAIQSPNYVAATAGWSIFQDGTAEFNNVTVRGEVDVNGSNGSQIRIYNNTPQAQIDLLPPTQVGHTLIPAQIFADVFAPGIVPELTLNSPEIDGFSAATIRMISTDSSGSIPPQIKLVADSVDFSATNQLIGGGNDARVYLTSFSDDYQCTTNIANLGGGEQTLAWNATPSYTSLKAGAKWRAFLVVDSQLNSTAGNVMQGKLYLNQAGGGLVAQTRMLHHGPAPSSAGDHMMVWSGTFAAGGSLAFSATVSISGPGNTGNNITAAQTALHIDIME